LWYFSRHLFSGFSVSLHGSLTATVPLLLLLLVRSLPEPLFEPGQEVGWKTDSQRRPRTDQDASLEARLSVPKLLEE